MSDQRPGPDGAGAEAYGAAMRLVGAAASARLVGTTVVLTAGFFTTVLAVRTFGTTLYGLVAFGLSAVDLVAVLVSLGLQQATVRAVAVLRIENDHAGMARLVRSLFTVLVLLGLVGATTVFVLNLSLRGAPFSDRLLLALGLAMLLVARNAASAIFALAQGLRRVVLMEIPNLVLVLGQFVVVSSLWLGDSRSISALGEGFIGAALIVLLVSARELAIILPRDQRRLRLAPRDAARFISSAAPYAVAGAAAEAIADFDVLTLGITGSSRDVGIYQPTLQVIDRLMIIPPTLLNAGFVPGATTLFHQGDSEGFANLYVTISKLAYVMAFPLVILLAAFPAAILHLLFGPQFPIRYDVVWVLLIGYAANLAFGLNAGALVATGQRRRLMAAYLIAFVTMVTLAVSLIPSFGTLGAAVATSASYLVMNGAVGWALYTGAHVHPFRKDMVLVIGTSLIPLAGSLAASRGLSGWPISMRIAAALVLTVCWLILLVVARVVRPADVAGIVPRRTKPGPPAG